MSLTACWCGSTEDVRSVNLTITNKDAREFGIQGDPSPSGHAVILARCEWCRDCRQRAGIFQLYPNLAEAP